jgi:hypothetical protein
MRAVLDLHARPGRLHHEGADLARLGIDGHHDQQLRDGAVRAPELGPVEDVGAAVRALLGRGREPGGIRPDVRLREGERGDLAARAAGEVLLLELRAAEELEGLGHADGLVRGEEGHDVAVHRAQELHDLLVFAVREPEAAVLLRDLHAEGAHLPQVLDHLVRVLAGGVDLHGVHVVAEETLHLVVERGELGALRARQRIGMDEVEPEVPQEQLAHEAGLRPFLLARGFRDLQGFPFGDFGRLASRHSDLHE